jgi:hypothetical protein
MTGFMKIILAASRARTSRAVLASIGMLVGLAGPTAAQQVAPQAEIQWRVLNSFRFFTDATDTEMHRATFLALNDAERQTPVLAAERALADRFRDGWAVDVLKNTCWNVGKNRHQCAEHADYAHPKSHRIVAEVKATESTEGASCTWLTAPRDGRTRGQSIRQACDRPVELELPYPGGARISVMVEGQELADTQAVVQDIFVVGFGDSFGSGEGNPDSPVKLSRERSADYGFRTKTMALAGYPARVGAWEQIGDRKFVTENAQWLDQACHRSLYSYQLRAALQLAIEDPHRSVTYVGLACSGAETTFGLFLRYKGHEWVPTPPDLSQVSAAADAQCGTTSAREVDVPEAYHMNERIPELKGGLVLRKCDLEKARKIDLLFLSVGGNDIGFSRLVANAILADQSTLRSLGGWFGQVHGAKEAQKGLEALEDRYKSLKRAFHNILHLPWGESDRVILSAYPPMALLEDGRSVCPDGQAGMTVLPDFQLSTSKARESSVAAEKLNALMRSSSRVNGWTFADGHRRQFQGRGVCAGFIADGYNVADDLRIPRFVDGKWQPYNPADWRAYASRQRWFRTPNDAFLTGNFHVSQSLLQSALKSQGYSWVQLLLASTYSGAFHPTAEGHAAMADATAEKAREVLKRYERRERAER